MTKLSFLAHIGCLIGVFSIISGISKIYITLDEQIKTLSKNLDEGIHMDSTLIAALEKRQELLGKF